MKIIVGVMGAGQQATPRDQDCAFELGQLIAQEGWVLLTGGRNEGVMDAANRGAKHSNGLTVGILPGNDLQQVSPAVDIPIVTGMGSARNNINVLSSQVIFACGMGSGTASEVALALKANRPVILLNASAACQAFFQEVRSDHIFIAATPKKAIDRAKKLIQNL